MVLRPALNPLSHTSQGCSVVFTLLSLTCSLDCGAGRTNTPIRMPAIPTHEKACLCLSAACLPPCTPCAGKHWSLPVARPGDHCFLAFGQGNHTLLLIVGLATSINRDDLRLRPRGGLCLSFLPLSPWVGLRWLPVLLGLWMRLLGM